MYNAVSAIRRIGSKMKFSNIIELASLMVSLPAIVLSIDQIMEKDKIEKEAKQKIEQVDQQLRYARDQVEQSRMQSEAAKLAAAAAASSAAELRQQNNFAEQSFLTQRYTSYQINRPRIEFVEVNKIDFSEIGPSKWVARFAKTGIPPSNVRTWTFSEVQKAGLKIPEFPDCDSNLYNNRGSFQNGTIFVDGPRIQQFQSRLIATGEHLFVMGGRICYGDDDGGLHATNFCISASGTNANWSYGSCSAANGSYTLRLPPHFEGLINQSRSR